MASRSLSQFSTEVVNFSSQYGRHSTQSYTASNLAGPPSIRDKYGDFVEAFVLRSYGKWWHICPSAVQKLSKVSPSFISEDFVELRFETAVIPSQINIYETYHPGCVVRILACNATSKDNAPGQVKWVTLWSGPPQCSNIPLATRKFSPPLRQISFPTNSIRLEFNSEECQYYTELDAVELVGKTPSAIGNLVDRGLGFQVDLTARILKNLSLLDRQVSTSSEDGDDDFDKWGFWAWLPDELIQTVFSYLDIISLCNVAQTCTLLLKNAYDPLLFSDLDLQSRWNTVDNVALLSLTSRCSNLQRLNLSWTGGGGLLTEDAFCRFIIEVGSELRTLRLACCQYIAEKALETVANVCTQLEELDLKSCTQLKEGALMHVGRMCNLRRLNLYGLRISYKAFQGIGNCTNIEHLNLGGSQRSDDSDYTDLLHPILGKLKNLISLDLWRVKHVEAKVITKIADNCPNLEELDIGWCGVLRDNFPCEYLCSKCPKLRKLFLTAGRNVNDMNMFSIAKHCKNMEQLDILGSNRVSEAAIVKIAKECRNLVFFDVSFCGQLTDEVVDRLRTNYPHVIFKKSFQEQIV